MIYLVMALRAEAKPVLTQWQFKRDKNFSHGRLYRSSTILLLITGMGFNHAYRAFEALLAYRQPEENDHFINLGLCAAPKEYPLGTVLLATKLIYKHKSVDLNTSFNHRLRTITLETVDAACSAPREHAVDMEAYAFYTLLAEPFKTQNQAFLKVVSDHFEPNDLDREEAIVLLQKALPQLHRLIEETEG